MLVCVAGNFAPTKRWPTIMGETMNAAQLKLALEMANDASIDLSGVDTTPLDNHETLKTTVIVPTAAVAAILRRDNPNMATLSHVGKHYIRIDDFRPAPRTPANPVQIIRTPAKRGRKPSAVVVPVESVESVVADVIAGETAPVETAAGETSNPFDAVEFAPVAPVVDDAPVLSKRELRRRAKLAKLESAE